MATCNTHYVVCVRIQSDHCYNHCTELPIYTCEHLCIHKTHCTAENWEKSADSSRCCSRMNQSLETELHSEVYVRLRPAHIYIEYVMTYFTIHVTRIFSLPINGKWKTYVEHLATSIIF